MTGLDWVILGIVLLLALIGWAQGFVTGVLAFVGFAVGAWIGTRIGPLLLSDGSRSPYAPLFGLLGAVIAGGALAAGFEGLGSRLRRAIGMVPGVTAVDGLLGAAFSACVGLGIVWLLGAFALQNGSLNLRDEVQRSTILSRLNDALPPSGGLLNELARFDPLPRVPGPEVRVDPPREGSTRRSTVRDARAAVVRILGSACGLGVEGSGWVAGDGVVVTNAHVVAGQDDTRVLLQGREPGVDAQVVHFDPRNDVAVLRVPGLSAPALELAASPRAGTSGAILGFPRNGPYDERAGRLGGTREVVTQDAYGRGPVRRAITSLRGAVRSGNSGGAMVDGAGRVITTIFAATISGPRGGYGVPNSVVRSALADSNGPVSTGPCA
jgi:uncharacterized membrane protein required for colicin V production